MSGRILTCSRCKATVIADSIETGRRKLDHSIGIYKGKPCEDGKARLFFAGEKTSKANNNKTISKKTTMVTTTSTIDKKHAESKSD